MASVRSELQSLMNRGKSVRDIEEPWWMPEYRSGMTYESAAESIGNIGESVKERKKEEKQQYGQDLLTQQRFDSRLNLPILNALSDSTIYDNKSIDEIESRLTSIKNEDIKRFPDQSIDFIDVYDTKINKLKEYRSLNNQYNHYVSKIPEAEKFLLDMTNELTDVGWEELTADDAKKKIEIKERLFTGTQQIAEFAKFMKNNQTYFANNKSFNTNKDNVDIGIIGGYNQLLAQINTIDPSGTIINEDEQRMLINSIRHKSPDEINQRNETIAKVADKRVLGYQSDFDQAHALHTKNTALMNSPDFKMEAARVDEEFKKFDEDLRSKLANGKIAEAEYKSKLSEYIKNPESWKGMLADGNQIDIMQTRTNQTALENTMLDADTKFEKETGSKYSEWMGRQLPWAETKEGEILTLKQKSNLVSLGYTEGDIGGMTYESALDVIKKQTKKTIAPSSLEKEKKIISESTSTGVKETGNKIINDITDLDKNIKSWNDSILTMEKDWEDLKTRKTEVDTALDEIRDAFPAPGLFTEGVTMPEDIKKRRKELLKEFHELKRKTKTAGSFYKSSPLARIDNAKKKRDELKEQRSAKKSQLDQLTKIR